MSLQPLDDRVLVRIQEPPEMVGGVHLPPQAQERSQRADVVAVGPGPRNPQTGVREYLDVSEGDVIVFSRFGGVEVTVDGDDFVLLREVDILAKETP